MTRAGRMRSTKVLRAGLLIGGRIVDERLLSRSGRLSVGTSERATFTIGGAGFEPVQEVLEWTERGLTLRFDRRMQGRVMLEGGVLELAALQSISRSVAFGFEIDLGFDARGKLGFGEASVLFQVVPEPDPAPRPTLPLRLRKSAFEVDWPTTLIAAFSFLTHFCAIGLFYSDWADPVVGDATSVAGLVDALPAIPVLPSKSDDFEQPFEPVRPGTVPEVSQPRCESGCRPSADAHAGLSSRLETLELQTLGVLTEGGVATRDVLGRGEVPTPDLDQAAARAIGTGITPELGLRTLGPVRPGETRGTFSDFAHTGRDARTDTGRVVRPKGPTGSVIVPPLETRGQIEDPGRVIAGLRPALRRCYQLGLDVHPDAEGSIRLAIEVGSNGETRSVSATSSGNLPPSVVSCVETRLRSAQFAAPVGGSALVIVPVTFKKQ